jgi:hypothetical protein
MAHRLEDGMHHAAAHALHPGYAHGAQPTMGQETGRLNSNHFVKPTQHMKRIAKGLAVASLVLGTFGMAMGFIYLAATSMADITAGTSGFMAGAILFGCGVLAISILSANE